MHIFKCSVFTVQAFHHSIVSYPYPSLICHLLEELTEEFPHVCYFLEQTVKNRVVVK